MKPSEMTSPKEALEKIAYKPLAGGEPTASLKECFDDAVEIAKAAIPVAELHQQVVDAVWILGSGYNIDDFWSKIRLIRTQLEALAKGEKENDG